MIGKSIIGSSFGGCIQYCLDPKKDPEILVSNGIYEGSANQLIHQFKMISEQAPNVKKPVWHSTISFAYNDKVNLELMKNVADDFLKEMKLDNNQYVIIKHNDTEHVHAHLVINRIGFDGSVARDWKCKYKTMKVMQELEKKYGLTIAKEQGNKRKKLIQEQLDIGLSKRENVDQIMSRVEQIGFQVEYNKTSKGTIRGIGFRNVEKGIYFKSSSIGRKYSYKNLLKATAKVVEHYQSRQISR
jgi:hypothetical protein